MATSFQITAKLHLVGPDNLRAISTKINKALSGVGGNIQIRGLDKLGQQLGKLRQQISSLGHTKGLSGFAGNLNTASVAAHKLGTATKQATVANRGFASSIASSTKSLAAFSVAAGVFLGTLGKIQGGLSEGISFDREMTRIGVVSGKTSKQLGGLKDQIHDLSIGLGVQSKGLVDSAMTLTQAGLAADKTRIALTALAKSDLAPTFDNIKNTTEGAIALFGSMGTSAHTLEADLGRLNRVSADYAVESSDLVTAVRKTGGAFAMAGGNLSELLGLFTSVRSRTRESANVIATSFRNIFARLQQPARQKNLKDLLGVDLAEGGQFVGPMKAIERLHDALKDQQPGSTIFARAVQEIGGIRNVSRVVPLIVEYKSALEAAGVAERGVNSLAKDSVLAQASLANAITKTTETWNKFYHNLTESSGFQSTIRSLLALSRGIANVAEKVTPLIPALATLGTISIGRMALGAVLKKADGGMVPGVGNTDSVPAALTPGEFVLRKSAVQKLGVGTLNRLNKFAEGGIVGGNRNGYGVADATQSLKTFAQAIRSFVGVIREEASAVRAVRLEKGNVPGAGHPLMPIRTASNRPAVYGSTGLLNNFSTGGADTYGIHPVGYKSNSFESTVLAGLPATNLRPIPLGEQDIGDPDLNPDRAEQRRLRRLNLKTLNRTQREARIMNLGRGHTLSHIRRSALAMQQSDYLNSIGFVQPTAGPGIARRTIGGATSAARQGISFLKNKGIGLRHVSTAGILGASYGLSQIGGATGTIGNGIIGGAATGLAAGSIAGPIGAGVGAAAGAITGLVRSLDELKTAAADKSIETGFARIETSLGGFAEALEKADGKITKDVQNRFGQVLGDYNASRHRNAAAQTVKESTLQHQGGGLLAHVALNTVGATPGVNFLSRKLLGVDTNDIGLHFDKLRSEESRQRVLADNIRSGEAVEPHSLNFLRSQLGGGKSFSSIMADKQNQDAINQIAEHRTNVKDSQIVGGLSPAERAKSIAQEKSAIVDESRARHDSLNKIKLNTDALDSFARSATAATSVVASLNNRFADFENGLKSVDNSNALLTGATGSGPASISNNQHSTALSRFGSAGFEHAASLLGTPAAGLLTNANRAHGALSSTLPGLLRSHDIGTEKGFANFQTNIGQAMTLNDVHPLMQQQIFEQLQNLKNEGKLNGDSDFTRGRDNAGFVERLTQSAEVKAAHAASLTQMQNAEAFQQRHLGNFGQLHGLINSAGEAADQSANLRLQTKQLMASQMVERFGGHETNYLKHSDYQAPLIAQQQRLTGLQGQASLDPKAIADRITQLMGKVDTANERRKNPADMKAVEDLRRFENELQNAVAGLRNLTDSSKLSAGAIDRLGHLNSDKQSRVGLAEQYITANPAERRELDRTTRLAKQVHTHGIESIPRAEDRRAALDRLRSFGDAEVFGGKMTGPQIANKAVEDSATYKAKFLNKKNEAERRQLQGVMLANAGIAEQAQGHLTGVQNIIAGGFGKNIGAGNISDLLPKPMGPMVMAPPSEDIATAKTARRELPGAADRRAAYTAGKQARKAAYKSRRGGGSADQAAPQSDFLNAFQSAGDGMKTAGQVFTSAAADLNKAADKLSGIPHTIDVSTKGEIQLVLNGAEMLAKLSPQIMELVSKSANALIKSRLEKHFPNAGPYT